MSVGEQVRVRRHLLGMSQADLAAQLRVRHRRVTPSYISRIESGRIDPRSATLRSLGRALGVQPWYFLWQPSENTPFVDAYLSLSPTAKKRVRDIIRNLAESRGRQMWDR